MLAPGSRLTTGVHGPEFNETAPTVFPRNFELAITKNTRQPGEKGKVPEVYNASILLLRIYSSHLPLAILGDRIKTTKHVDPKSEKTATRNCISKPQNT
jgi:hypothetical protein